MPVAPEPVSSSPTGSVESASASAEETILIVIHDEDLMATQGESNWCDVPLIGLGCGPVSIASGIWSTGNLVVDNYASNGFVNGTAHNLADIGGPVAEWLKNPPAAIYRECGQDFGDFQTCVGALGTGVVINRLLPGRDVTPGRSTVSGSVVRNALEDHEYAQALRITDYRGGNLIGNERVGAPGIDGTLDGVPVSLKTYTGVSPQGVLKKASDAELSANKAGILGVDDLEVLGATGTNSQTCHRREETVQDTKHGASLIGPRRAWSTHTTEFRARTACV